MTTEAPDNTDAGRILKADALNQAAAEIMRQHEDFIQTRYHAGNYLKSTCEAAIRISALVEQVHATLGGARFAQWWRDQGLPDGWGKRYLTISKSRRDNIEADKDQLRLIGLLPEPSGHNEGHTRQDHSAFAWIKWAAKIPKSFSVDRAKGMDETDRRAALKHLEPIERLIAELKSGL